MKLSKRERTQKEIMEAAKAIIHAKGHEAVTVRYLAEETGYSYTNLYHYFEDMSSFLWALRIHMIEDMIVELSTDSITTVNCVDNLFCAISRYMDYFYKNPNVFRFFYFYPFSQPEGDDSYQKIEQRFQGIWRTAFYGLIQEGIISVDDIAVVSKTIIYAMNGMIMLSLSSNGNSNIDDAKRELSELVNYLLN